MGFEIGRLTRIPLGREGESNARPIEINVADWLTDYPGSTVGLLLMRPGEDTFYTANVEVREGVLHYTPNRADVELPGEGLAQIVLTNEDDVELRSRVVKTLVEASLPGSAAEAPEKPMQPFVDAVLAAAAQAKQAAEDAAEHKLDGFSPSAKVESTPDGAVVTITDKDGTTSVTLTEGIDGNDGVSPIVTLTKADGVTTLTVTDAEDTETVEIEDGKDGSSGVWVGSEEPTGDETVWVDPEGEATTEGTWELIETITLAEAAQSIERTQEPDGTAYNFKAAMVRAYTPSADAAGYTQARFYGDTFNITLYFENGLGTYERRWMASAYPEYGRMTGKGVPPVTNIYDSPGTYRAPTYGYNFGVAGSINRILLNGGVSYPARSVLEIWGVRANA